MRYPNGYGSVIKLSGNRRRPYLVRVTKGWTDDGKQQYQNLAYFAKRQDAISFLAEFNNAPFNLDYAKITFSEVYAAWSKEAFKKMLPAVAANYKSAYNVHCKDLYETPYRTIRKHDFQAALDNCSRSYSVKCSIRNLFSHLDAWCYDRDIISKMYSVNLDCGEPDQKTERNVFTDQEVKKLFNHVGTPFIDDTIVQIYTGFRVSELLALTADSIDMKQEIITGGGKTAAGKNRIVPLAEIGIDHTTHDCRHTFRSKLDSANANKVSIDLLMGHKSKDVGERVYTHKTIEELKTAIMLLKF